MPPVYSGRLYPQIVYDGTEILDFRSQGIPLCYIPDGVMPPPGFIDYLVSESGGPLRDHTYIGSFGRTINPQRLVHASVPHRPRYRYKGKDLTPLRDSRYDEGVAQILEQLIDANHTEWTVHPNATITNGYRYNGVDYISPHTDDEKFLRVDNSLDFPRESVVATVTLLTNPDAPMTYVFQDRDQRGPAYGITLRHGSVVYQGSVIHYVPPVRGDGSVGRISVTYRTLDDSCPCTKISCPYTYGPSNYLYYSGSYIK